MKNWSKGVISLLITALLVLAPAMEPYAASTDLKLHAAGIRITVAYDANGGTGAPGRHAARVSGDTAAFQLSTTIPKRPGYKFIGWRLDNSSDYAIDSPGQSIAIGVAESGTLTYYAQWRKEAGSARAVVSYDANGGSGAPSSQAVAVEDDTAVFKLLTTVPTRTGYKFIGWRYDNDRAYDIDSPGQSIVIEAYDGETLTYYAQWEKEAEGTGQITISYDSNGGGGAPFRQTAAVKNGIAEFTIPAAVPERAGYTFKGWRYLNGSREQLYSPGQAVQLKVVSENMLAIFFAQWEKEAEKEPEKEPENTFQAVVVYNANGGSGEPLSHTVTVKDGAAEFSLPAAAPERTGYTFTGWKYENRSSEPLLRPGQSIRLNLSASVTATFYAQWEKEAEKEPENTFQAVVVYNANGGSGEPLSHTVTVKDGAAEFSLPAAAPERTGYTFTGWKYENKSSEPLLRPGQSIRLNLSASVTATFYAQWEKNAPSSYTIVYILNGGTNNRSNPSSYTPQANTLLYNPTRTGYTFGGWYTDSSFRTRVTQIIKGSTGNKTLYAKWTAVSYRITYYLNGGKNHAGNPSSYNVSSARITLKDPSRSGYTFKGWYQDSSFRTKVTNIAKGSTGNKTFYAKWEKKPSSNSSNSAVSAKDTNTSLAKSADAWKNWSQNKSKKAVPVMSSGCRVTSFAMMLAEAGCASDFNNPTEFYNIMKNLKAFKKDGITENGFFGFIVEKYAEAHGGTVTVKTYDGRNRKYDATLIENLKKTSDLSGTEGKVMDILKDGKYAAISMTGTSMHTVYVMREKSLAEGVVWIADPNGGKNYKYTDLIKYYKGWKINCRSFALKNIKKR